MWKDTLVLQTRTTGGGLFYCLLQKVVHTVTCQRRTAGIRKSQPSATFAQFPEPRLKSFGCCRPQRDRALLPPFSCKTDERRVCPARITVNCLNPRPFSDLRELSVFA